MSAASVALLAGRADAGAVAELRTALSHPTPLVRTVAARLAGIQKMQALAGDAARVLESEPDEQAAAEQLRALLFMDSTAWRDAVKRRLSPSQPNAVRAHVEWIARNHPEMPVSSSQPATARA